MEEKKRGRRSIYETVILPNLEQISKWARAGATEKQICEALQISVSAFNVHKEKKELKEALEKNRTQLFLELKGELIGLAKKHTLETKKQYIKKDLETGTQTQYTEITTKEVDPNFSALNLLLHNLNKEEWKMNWDNFDLKQAELELRKKMNEEEKW